VLSGTGGVEGGTARGREKFTLVPREKVKIGAGFFPRNDFFSD